MAGSDKRVFTELWKYGVLVSRKLKGDDVNESKSQSFRGTHFKPTSGLDDMLDVNS